MSLQLPFQVGITGGIGSGKTTVCKIFESLGVPVYYADERAKWLSNHHPQIKQEIIELLGEKAYDATGEYDRRYVGSRVFQNKPLLQELNQIIHPRVAEDTQRWLEMHTHVPYVLKEAAIMNRAGDGNTLQAIVAVVAPEDIRMARVLERDPHRSFDQIQGIIRSQVTEKELRGIADYVIDNSGDVPLLPQVLALHSIWSSDQ